MVYYEQCALVCCNWQLPAEVIYSASALVPSGLVGQDTPFSESKVLRCLHYFHLFHILIITGLGVI